MTNPDPKIEAREKKLLEDIYLENDFRKIELIKQYGEERYEDGFFLNKL